MQFDESCHKFGQNLAMINQKHTQQGFTLIELMIVVTIIGILAAVAIPMYLDYTVRTQVSEGLNLASGAKNAVTEYFQDRGSLPTGNSTAGLSASNEIQGKFVTDVSVGNQDGIITVTFGNDVNALIFGDTLTLTANTTRAGSVQWICASADLQDKHLPAACR